MTASGAELGQASMEVWRDRGVFSQGVFGGLLSVVPDPQMKEVRLPACLN